MKFEILIKQTGTATAYVEAESLEAARIKAQEQLTAGTLDIEIAAEWEEETITNVLPIV